MYFRRGCLSRAGPAKTAGKPPGFWAGPAAPGGLRAGEFHPGRQRHPGEGWAAGREGISLCGCLICRPQGPGGVPKHAPGAIVRKHRHYQSIGGLFYG